MKAILKLCQHLLSINKLLKPRTLKMVHDAIDECEKTQIKIDELEQSQETLKAIELVNEKGLFKKLYKKNNNWRINMGYGSSWSLDAWYKYQLEQEGK